MKCMKNIYIDASCITRSDCLCRLAYIHEGLTKQPTIDLVFGIAFHKFAESMEKMDIIDAMHQAQRWFLEKEAQCPKTSKKDHLNIGLLTKVCMEYHDRFQKDTFKTIYTEKNTPLVEVKFCFPWLVLEDIQYHLCGTIDRIGRVGTNGVYAIMDYKTTSAWDKEKYLDGYRLSPQLMIYALAVQHYAHDPEDMFWKNINPLRVCIEGIFLKKDGVEFARSQMFEFSKELLEEFKDILNDRLLQYHRYCNITPRTRDGILTKACQTIFGPCEYLPLCVAPNNQVREQFKKTMYITREFNPLKYNE